MAGLLEIYNTALYRVKETPLVSVTDTSARLWRLRVLRHSASGVAPPVSVAVRHPAADFVPLGERSPFGFKKQFQLPADALAVVAVGTDEDTGRWNMGGVSGEYRIENGRIMSDSDTVYVVYTKDETDASKFDPLFVDALAWMVAADLALALAADRELHLTASQQADRAILAARRAGSIEQSTETIVMGSRILDGRLGGASAWNPRWPEALP